MTRAFRADFSIRLEYHAKPAILRPDKQFILAREDCLVADTDFAIFGNFDARDAP
jgi:hypothetical protein